MTRVVEVRESALGVEPREEGLLLRLPRRRKLSQLGLAAWFALIWTAGLVSMITGEPPENSGGSLFIVLWGAIGVVGVSLASWSALYGEEVLLDGEHLTHTRVLGPIRMGRSFTRDRIEDVRVSAESRSMFDARANFAVTGFGNVGLIAFDYGDTTVRLGDIEEAEAKRAVAALQRALRD